MAGEGCGGGCVPRPRPPVAMVRLFPETDDEDWLLRFLYPILIAITFLIAFALITFSPTPTG